MSPATALAALAFVLAAAGCSPQVTRHGHLISQSDLQQIQPGMSKEQVRLVLGTPDTTSTVGGNAYYYISTTTKTVAFMKPKVIDRRVIAIYFDQFGTVERIANYGLKDGKVFDFIRRETPSSIGETSFLGQIFKGLGKPQVGGDGS